MEKVETKKPKSRKEKKSKKEPKPLVELFSSVNSVLVEDGKNIIDEIKHIEYKQLNDNKEEALLTLDEDGCLILRNAIDKMLILEACNFLESYLSDLGFTQGLTGSQRRIYRSQVLSGCLDINQNQTFM